MTLKELTDKIQKEFPKPFSIRPLKNKYVVYVRQEVHDLIIEDLLTIQKPILVSEEDIVISNIVELQIPNIGHITFKIGDFELKIEKHE